MTTTGTAKKMNAIDTALSLLNEAGVESCEFNANNLQDDEVKYVAENHKVELHQPDGDAPYFWCIIPKGSHTIRVRGIKKKVKVIE